MAKAGTQQRYQSMPDIIAVKTAHNVFVVHPNFVDDVRYVPMNQMVKIKITKSRNLKFLAKYWVMIGKVFEIEAVQREFKTIEETSNQLKIDSGYCYTRQHEIEGLKVITKTPKSISIEAMDEIEFNKFYNTVINVILNEWLERYVPHQVDQYADYFAREF